MERIVAALCALLFLCPSVASAGVHRSRLAPADEYFGHLKMSIIGIKNELQRVAGRIDGDPRHAESQLGTCRDIANALEDFGNKYPHDTWLPAMAVSLESMYARMRSSTGRAHVNDLLAWVHSHFPDSPMETRMKAIASR